MEPFNKLQAINHIIKVEKVDTNLVSDGYHTFGELYEHRIQLYITLCFIIELQHNFMRKSVVWRSKTHHDGSAWDGWFLMGVFEEPGQQITYHLPMKHWEDCGFAQERDRAPEFDGHSSEDVLNRLRTLYLSQNPQAGE